MFFIPVNLKTNYTKEEYAIADTPNPIFSWGVKYDEKGGYQSEYRIKVTFNNTVLWDSGFVADSNYPLAFIVCVEDGGYGAQVCLPIASRVLNACVDAINNSD